MSEIYWIEIFDQQNVLIVKNKFREMIQGVRPETTR